MRTWSYNSASFRSVRILSWDHGVGCLLNSLQALKTLTALQVDFLAFSQTKLRALQALFRNEACRIDDFRLCCCPSVHQCYKIASIIPILPSGHNAPHHPLRLRRLSLWGCDLSQRYTGLLLAFLGKWPSTQQLVLGRRRLSHQPSNEAFFVDILAQGNLTHLLKHVKGGRAGDYHCLDLGVMLPTLVSSPCSKQLEHLLLECMKVTREEADKLLWSLAQGQLPRLRYLKIVNLPNILQHDEDHFLDISSFLESQRTTTNL